MERVRWCCVWSVWIKTRPAATPRFSFLGSSVRLRPSRLLPACAWEARKRIQYYILHKETRMKHLDQAVNEGFDAPSLTLARADMVVLYAQALGGRSRRFQIQQNTQFPSD